MQHASRLSAFVRRRYRVLLLLVLLLAAGFRVATWADRVAHDPEFDHPALDSRIFLEWAGEIAAGDVLGDRPFFLNPLYPYLLAPILRVAGEGALDATRLIQTLLGLATVLLVTDATRRLLGRSAAILAGALTALYPLLPFYEQTIMIVAVAVFLNALLLWLLARFAETRRIGAAILAGLTLGLSVLARPNVGLFGVFLPLWFLTLAPEGRSRLAFAASRTLLVAAGAVVAILPVAIRNWVVGKDLVAVTWSAGVNLYQSNSPAARRTGLMVSDEMRGHPILIENDARLVAEQQEGRALKPSEVSGYWSGRALAAMAEEPGAALAFLGRKLLLFLAGGELPSSYHYEAQRAELPTLRFAPLSFTVICPLALLGLLLAVKGRRGALPHLLFFLAYAIGLAIFFPLGHYRAPVLPAAFPLAAIGAIGVARALVEGPGRRRAAWIAAALLAVVVTSAPALLRAAGVADWGDEVRTRVVFFYNRGIHAVRRGDLDVADEAFRKANELDPDSVLPDQGMADLALAREDVPGEARHLEAVLRKRPDDPPTLARYGLALLKMGLPDTGLAKAQRAVRLAPMDWIVHSSLGEIYERMGRFRDALRSYDRAVACGVPETEVLADITRCLRALGNPREALRRLERGLRVQPGSTKLRLEKVLALIQTGSAHPGMVRLEVEHLRADGVAIPPEVEAWLRERR